MSEEDKNIPSTPAGKDDNIKVKVLDIKQICEENQKPKMETLSGAKYTGILSTELNEGVSIKAYKNDEKFEPKETR